MRWPLRSRVPKPATLQSHVSFALAAGIGLASLVWLVLTLIAGKGGWLVPLIGVILSISIWFAVQFASQFFVEPFEKLAHWSRSGDGGYPRRLTIEGPAESRDTARTLNDLSDAVQQTMHDLREEEQRKIRFVSDVSHELRTPLTAIRGAAETLLDGDMIYEDQQRFLSTICAESERLTRLAADLLTLQRIEGATGELPMRRTDLRAVCDAVADMLEPLLDEREVELMVFGTGPPVLGDPDRLHQVIANLVDNASRAVGPGGRIAVSLSKDEDFTCVEVVDNGPGIALEDPNRLFDRFFRGDASRTRTSGGTGLGLAIVKAIVNAHSGTVDAASPEGGGAKFTVRLPALPVVRGDSPELR